MKIIRDLSAIVLAATIGLTGCDSNNTSIENKNYHQVKYAFETPEKYIQFSKCDSFAVVDWDGDGRLDIISSGSKYKDGTFPVYVHLNKKDGFYKLEQPIANVAGNNLAVADWDGDGKLDLITNDGNGRLFVYRNITPSQKTTESTKVTAEQPVQF